MASGTELKTTTSGGITIKCSGATLYKVTAVGNIRIYKMTQGAQIGTGAAGDISILDTISSGNAIDIYTNGNLDIQADITATNRIYALADNENDGVGNLTFSNSPTLTAGTSTDWLNLKGANSMILSGNGAQNGPITLTTSGSASTATLVGGDQLGVTVTGDGTGTELTITGAISRSKMINLFSYGDLDIQDNVTTATSLYCYADNDEDGSGNLTFQDSPTLTAGADTPLYLKAANLITLTGNGAQNGPITISTSGSSSTATLSGGDKLTAHATGEGAGTELTVDGAISRSDIIYLYSNGDARPKT